MRGKTYEIEEVAKTISENHAKWHLSKSDQNWQELNIGRENFAKHIEFVLKSPDTKVFQALNNCKDKYYHKGTNTYVVVDLTNKHMGTCFRPTKKEKYFDEQIEEDVKARNVAKIKKAEIKKGGYDALYKGKMIDKNLRNELLKRAEEKQKEERVKKKIRILNESIVNKNKKRIADIENRIVTLKKDKSIDSKQRDEEIKRLEEELRKLKELQRKLEREKEREKER